MDEQKQDLGQPQAPAQVVANNNNISLPKSKKKFPIIIAAVVVVVLAVAAWFLVFNKTNKPTTTVTNGTPNNRTEEPTSTGAQLPNKVVAQDVIYAYSQISSSSTKIYSRPVSGGDRKELLGFSSGEVMESYSVKGQHIALAITGGSPKGLKVMYSKDGGASFSTIYQKANAELQVTSMQLSDDSGSLAMAILESPTSKNKVYDVPLNGSGAIKELFTANTAGVVMYGYNTKTNRVVYSETCWNCDGFNNKEILAYNVNSKTSKSLYISPIGGLSLGINNDGTEVVVAEGSKYTGPAPDGLGGPITQPPYKFYSVNIDTADKKQIGETNDKVRDMGFIPNDKTYQAYYVDDKRLAVIGNTPVTKFEADKQISELVYASDSVIVVASGNPDSFGSVTDYTLNTFKISDKSTAKVLDGDPQTTIMGVTTK